MRPRSVARSAALEAAIAGVEKVDRSIPYGEGGCDFMRIRPYRRGDARAFIGLVRALARYEKLPPPKPAAARRLVGDIGRRIEVLLGEVDGKPVAYAIYLFTYSSFLARPTFYLEDIFILPEYRGAGRGREFFEALRRIARRKKCGRMEWVVLDWNKAAIRFYDKTGARPLKEWITYRLSLRG